MEPPFTHETPGFEFEKEVCGFEDEFTLSAGSCCDDGEAPKPE